MTSIGYTHVACIATLLMFSTGVFQVQAQWQPYNSNSGTYFTGTNNVSIGNSTPTIDARLTLDAPWSVWQLRLRAMDGTQPQNNDWWIGASSSLWGAGGGKLLITKNTTNSANSLFAIDASGNVGIGTTAPAYKLDVNGAVNATAAWVGVTAAPSGYKLAVGGKAIAEEVVIKLQASWPDYVFADTYKLPSLLELERYIRQNKHLPDVPTAQEVKADGISVGEMNAVLLKKVEELTLYVIELKKEVETLKGAVAQQGTGGR